MSVKVIFGLFQDKDDQEKPSSNSSSLSDDDPNLDSPKVLLHHSNSEDFEDKTEADEVTEAVVSEDAEKGVNHSSRYLLFSASAAEAIRAKLGLASSAMDSADQKELLDSDVESEPAVEPTKKHSRVSAIKNSVLLCFNSRTLAEFFHARHGHADKNSNRSSIVDLPDDGVAGSMSSCQFLATDTSGRVFEVREFPRSSLVGSPSQLSLDEQYIKSQKQVSESDLFGESASVYDGFIGLRKLNAKDDLPERSDITISSPDLAGKPAEESLEQKTSPKYKSAEVLSMSSVVMQAEVQSDRYPSAEVLQQKMICRTPLKAQLSGEREESSLSSLEEVENVVLAKPAQKGRPRQQLTVTSNTSLTSNSSNDSHDSGISADMSDSGRQSEGEQARPLDVIKEAENNGAGSPEAATTKVDIVTVVDTGVEPGTQTPESFSDRSSDSTSSSASLDEQVLSPPEACTSLETEEFSKIETSTKEFQSPANGIASGKPRESSSSTSSDSDDTVVAADRSPDWTISSPPGDITSFYTLTASDDEEEGAVGGAEKSECPSLPCFLPDYQAEVYFSDSDEEEGDLVFGEEDIGTFSFDRFCIPDDVDAFCFSSIDADLCQTRSHSLKSESVSSEDSSATVIENPLSKEEEDLDSVFVEGAPIAEAPKPRVQLETVMEQQPVQVVQQQEQQPTKRTSSPLQVPTIKLRMPKPEVPQYSSQKSLFHRYYHVFKQGELDELIEKHVDNLHIIKSFYDHSNWCVIAEKVQVWSI